MDEAAKVAGVGPAEIRHRNLVDASEFPYRNVMGAIYDRGTYRESLALCAELLRYGDWTAQQQRARAEGKLAGLGFACLVEPTAYGTGSFGSRKMTIVPGYERATVRMDPSGSVMIMVGTLSHGQGHATTYAADRGGHTQRRPRSDLAPSGRHRGSAARLGNLCESLDRGRRRGNCPSFRDACMPAEEDCGAPSRGQLLTT